MPLEELSTTEIRKTVADMQEVGIESSRDGGSAPSVKVYLFATLEAVEDNCSTLF